MKKLLVIVTIAILAVLASAAKAERPRGQVVINKSVCQSLTRFRSFSPPFRVQMKRVDVYVDGHWIDAIWESPRSVYWAGRATFVQLHALNNRFAWTMIRSVPRCAHLRVVYEW